MNAPQFDRVRVGFVALCLLALVPLAHASMGITAVYSKTSDDYVRQASPDGTVQAETYAFGDGGYYGGPISDNTIDNLGFTDIAHTLAASLATQNYLPARDPKNTGLLIMVYWGATSGPEDFAGSRFGTGPSLTGYEFTGMQTVMTRERNAGILGYTSELGRASTSALSLWYERDDINQELDSSRYFVVLMAYDFQTMWREKKHKLVWEARFSVREQGNDFTRALPAMAEYASQYFGRDSHGLLRTHVPDGRIDVGDPTLVEFLTETPARR
jgi:hypothetical protein